MDKEIVNAFKKRLDLFSDSPDVVELLLPINDYDCTRSGCAYRGAVETRNTDDGIHRGDHMKTYYVTVEGLVSRVICVDADNVAKAMEWAKADFKSAVGADNAVVVAANEEKTNG
jgi:hypothetical protein